VSDQLHAPNALPLEKSFQYATDRRLDRPQSWCGLAKILYEILFTAITSRMTVQNFEVISDMSNGNRICT
jgi:hypothetical protein